MIAPGCVEPRSQIRWGVAIDPEHEPSLELCDDACLASPIATSETKAFSHYNCPARERNTTRPDGNVTAETIHRYSDVGTLLLGSGERAVRALFVRGESPSMPS